MVILIYLVMLLPAYAQQPIAISSGADQTENYLSLLKGKRVGLIANQTSLINGIHLADTLRSLQMNITAVFAPEHGFRGEAEAGATVKNSIDVKTGIKIISLYGDHKKPTTEDLKNIDILVYDIQDVGVRFYTYLSTLQYVMEAAAERQLPLIILDRPDPHGFYIDGPVLDTSFRSFVGMNPIPVVHGLTTGEYALMLNGEGWLKNHEKCSLQIVKVTGWDHRMTYHLPVPPSPNLPVDAAVMLYPSLCFFEGTIVSVGRGTDEPFQLIGYPGNPEGDINFTPVSIPGKALHPLYENKVCRGFSLKDFGDDIAKNAGRLFINWLIQSYHTCPDTSTFFNPFFDKLAGTDQLRKQISQGWTEEQIRNSWGPGLMEYRRLRKKYLLYQDFE